MIHNKPFIVINRLVVFNKQGSVAYDQEFHLGVNIIRGENSSGKSTIANFIFYGLGGDYNNWTDAAESCDAVFLETEINGKIFTLKRMISQYAKQGMYVYNGYYSEASLNTSGWSFFSYSRSDNKISFSNLIFELLEFPELRGDIDSNITMHQILRLLYIDQKSLTESFLRTEQFDSPLTRKTIYELLLGVYDDSLYSDRLDLREAEKEIDSNKKQLEGIKRIFLNSGNEIEKDILQNLIEGARTQLEKIQYALQEKQKITIEEKDIEQSLKKDIQELQEKIFQKKFELRKINEDIQESVLDITDSQFFVSTLQERIMAIEDSITTKNILGEIPLTYCPQCLSKLEKHLEMSTCSLCKQPLKIEENKSSRGRMLQELVLQKRESEVLLKQKDEKLKNQKILIPRLREEIILLQSQLDDNLKKIQSTRDNTIDELLVKKGNLESNINFLIKQINFVEQYNSLKVEIEKMETLIRLLQGRISDKERQQSSRLTKAHEVIERFALYLLKNDLDRQTEFKTGISIGIDLGKNTYSLDGKNNFSESSKTYLKNCIRYAIFFASLELDFFRFPKFILCDNMEDKGMEKVRSQNFQNLITTLSGSFQKAHQIIFTTSMISDELDNTPHCIGPYYTETNKSLKV